jgi:hypothetical protein
MSERLTIAEAAALIGVGERVVRLYVLNLKLSGKSSGPDAHVTRASANAYIARRAKALEARRAHAIPPRHARGGE